MVLLQSIVKYINTIWTNTDPTTVTILLAVIGWIIALFLQRLNVRHQHKVDIHYDIYKQFIQLHQDLQNTLAEFGAKTSTPFILMESSMIPFQLKLKKQYKEVWLEYTEMECLIEGENKWTAFARELQQKNIELNDKYIAILYLFGDWTAALKSLLPTKDILAKEVNQRREQISENLSLLQMYTTNNGHDWRIWNRDKVEEITKKIQ